MKKYYKFLDPEGVECFLEIFENYCERAVFKTENKFFNTYVDVNHEEYFLPEGDLEESYDFMIPSTEDEFIKIWDESMSKCEEKWIKFKAKMQLSKTLKTKIICFYPQGVILDFGQMFYGITDIDNCKKHLDTSTMYPEASITLNASKFDDENKLVHFE